MAPLKAWAFVPAAGLLVLSSFGPSYGAVLAWVERHRRLGLAELRDGARVVPVLICPDFQRDETAPIAARRVLTGTRR